MPVSVYYVVCVISGGLVGGTVAWLLAGSRARLQVAELRDQLARTSKNETTLRSQLDSERGAKIIAEEASKHAKELVEAERETLERAQAKLTDVFKALAGETLDKTSASFLRLADTAFGEAETKVTGELELRKEAIKGLVGPLGAALEKLNDSVHALETRRTGAYSELQGLITNLTSTQEQLKNETANLVTALRVPHVRGRWGELTLIRVVELVGMSDHCDFTEQVTVEAEGGRLRPDLVVHLPGEREIVVDAKVALDAYLDAVEATSEEARSRALNRHAAQMRKHMMALADKDYQKQFKKAPDFVVMFIPGEAFFAAAADTDRALIADALEKRVVMATPATLIALIRAVESGWRQEATAKNARDISDLGNLLHDRMRVMAEHIIEIGAGLDRANEAYNSAVGSLERRALVAARGFRRLGAATGDEISELPFIDPEHRRFSAPELTEDL